jgi:fructose-1-phosphate kinase PfkB-like protein
MSIYVQYADAIRKSQATWDRAVEVLTDTAKESLVQVQATRATAIKVDPTENLVSYLNRALEVQSDVSKKFASLTASFSEQVLTQGEALATAVREYMATAQEVLRDQADKQHHEFVQVRERAEQALRTLTPAGPTGRPARTADTAAN